MPKKDQKLISENIHPHIARADVKPLAKVKNIIGVASGKGGVGKSTVAVNLAVALSEAGASVGILDADVYGPSQPHLLGICAKPEMNEQRQLIPLRQYGLDSMSMGYLVDEKTAMVWRGPMISSALDQLLNKTCWSDLDYLIVDLPPGTGDIPLTLAKKTPLSAVVLVTTPQDLALLDVRKAITMFNKLSIPILGVIENMSSHVCQQCGYEEAIFGEKGGQRLAEEFTIPVLGQLPLTMAVREASDQQRPIVLDKQQPDIAAKYQAIALKIAELLEQQKKSYAHLFNRIAVE